MFSHFYMNLAHDGGFMKKSSVTKIIMLLLAASFVIDVQAMDRKRKPDGEPEATVQVKGHRVDPTDISAGAESAAGRRVDPVEEKKEEKKHEETKEEKRLEENKGPIELVYIDRKELDKDKSAAARTIMKALALGTSDINLFDWLKRIRLNGFVFDKKLARFIPDAHVTGQPTQKIQLCALSKEVISGKIPVMTLYILSFFITPNSHVSMSGELYLLPGHNEKIVEDTNLNHFKLSDKMVAYGRYNWYLNNFYIGFIQTNSTEKRKGFASHLVNNLINATKPTSCIFTANANAYSSGLFEKLRFNRVNDEIRKKYCLRGDITHILTTHQPTD